MNGQRLLIFAAIITVLGVLALTNVIPPGVWVVAFLVTHVWYYVPLMIRRR